jgi:integrase
LVEEQEPGERSVSVRKRKGSPYWQIRFELAGREYRLSSGTADKKAAQELEQSTRADLWRQIKLGERRHTWDEAVAKCRAEDSHQNSWDRTQRSLNWFAPHLEGRLLSEINYENILKLRALRQGEGAALSTINREFSVLRSILKRCVEPWKLIESVPKVPMYRLPKIPPVWITREQAHALLGQLPKHSRDMMIFALATGLRRSNVTGMEWNRVDMQRATAFVPANEAKGREAITVPLNADALAVLERWKGRHRRYVFCFRQRAPIYQVTTRAWRKACKAAELDGVTFHTMRHSWASWQIQAETPLKMLQEMGGWATLEMPLRYAHLSPGHLAHYADRTLLGTEAGTLKQPAKSDALSSCIGGKGGTRTLDPGIMSTALKRKA